MNLLYLAISLTFCLPLTLAVMHIGMGGVGGFTNATIFSADVNQPVALNTSSDSFTSRIGWLDRFALYNGSDAQVGVIAANSSPIWNYNLTVTGSGTCRPVIGRLGVTDANITDKDGVSVYNYGNATHLNFGCSWFKSPYNITYSTEKYNQTIEGEVNYVGILGSYQRRISVMAQYNQSAVYEFSYDPPINSGLWLYLCNRTTNASCTVGGIWELQTFETTVKKNFSLVSNETVFIVSYTLSTSAGGGGGAAGPVEEAIEEAEEAFETFIETDPIAASIILALGNIEEFLKSKTGDMVNLIWVLAALMLVLIFDNVNKEARRNFTTLSVMSIMSFVFLYWRFGSLLSVGII